jgi:hypothetical protein
MWHYFQYGVLYCSNLVFSHFICFIYSFLKYIPVKFILILRWIHPSVSRMVYLLGVFSSLHSQSN